jgi:hypothetical protein
LANGTNTFTMGVNDQNIAAQGGTLLIDAGNFLLGVITESSSTNITLDMRGGSLSNLDGASLATIDTLVFNANQVSGVTNWGSIDWDGVGLLAPITNFAGGLNIKGSAGVQALTGSAGNDVIETGAGADTVNLGAGGIDSVVYSSREANDVNITGFTTGTGGDILNFANLTLTDGVTANGLVFQNRASGVEIIANATVVGFAVLQLDTAENVATAIQDISAGLGEASKMVFLIADTDNDKIGVWSWEDSADSDLGGINASELLLLGNLEGYAGAATTALAAMTAANFSYNFIV